MAFEIPNFYPALPEIIIFALSSLCLLAHAFLGDKRSNVTYYLVQISILISLAVTYLFLEIDAKQLTFDNTFVVDKFSVILKLFAQLSVFLCFLYSRVYIKDHKMPRGEYYLLGLFSMMGMMVLISSNHFLTLFLGLELTSLPVYAMVALKRDSTVSTEAAIKYFIVGAIATGMLLYGLSMLYGATGHLEFNQVANSIAQMGSGQRMLVLFGLVFAMVGIAFKLGAVPFHMWVPDVYQGAPSSVTMFIATAPKIAAMGMAVRLLVNAMPDINFQWQQILIAISILSMGLGNFGAIAQTNIKRMLAYSSIAHMGYMVLGLLTATKAGYAASTFYMVTYSLMTLGAFGLIVMLSQAGYEFEEIDDFKGLNAKSPWLAFMMMILMFSMAGVPPVVGFMAKLAVLKALIASGFVWLAVLALLFAIVGAYYYIRIVKVMYFEEPEKVSPLSCPRDMTIAISVNALAVLALGVFPSALLALCQSAF